MKPRRRAAKFAALVFYIIVILVATPQAQQPVSFAGAPGAMTGGARPVPADRRLSTPGRALNDSHVACRARGCRDVPDVADAMVRPQKLLSYGSPGRSRCSCGIGRRLNRMSDRARRDLTHLRTMTDLFQASHLGLGSAGRRAVRHVTASTSSTMRRKFGRRRRKKICVNC